MKLARYCCIFLLSLLLVGSLAHAETAGYYRQPSLRGNQLVFVAEGDIWKVSSEGGVAHRLTSHPGQESHPVLSPDGRHVAFLARYEGPRELYTMPTSGGRPTRWTYGESPDHISSWKDAQTVMVSTEVFSTLPSAQLALVDVSDPARAGRIERVPLAQAADGDWSTIGALFFTRLPFQGSQTKRYKGGTAQQLWRFDGEGIEARPLTQDFPGTSKDPMWFEDRVWFASDRDGTMNLWSMQPDGSDLIQHTQHDGMDIKDPASDLGRFVYQLGADLYIYKPRDNSSKKISITLDSDLDQTRENWVKNPQSYITSAHLSGDGEKLVLTARGNVFVAPRKQGRLVQTGARRGVRYRDARFMPDSDKLLVLSDASGEVELATLPSNGVGEEKQLTNGGDSLRWESVPSPDGKWIAHHDKKQRLWLYDVENESQKLIHENEIGGFNGLSWSPDSAWLAYSTSAGNLMSRVHLYEAASGDNVIATTDRYNSYSPTWSRDGKWLYFLTDRNLRSIVGSPWGAYQPEPHLAFTTVIYELALTTDARSPFALDDETVGNVDGDKAESNESEAKKPNKGKKKKGKQKDDEADSDSEEGGKDTGIAVKIEREGLQQRLRRLPVDPGRYGSLTATDKHLYFSSFALAGPSKVHALEIKSDPGKPKTVIDGVGAYELSADQKKMLLRKGGSYYIVSANGSKADLKDAKVDLSGWSMSVIPQDEWRQMFVEAWRLERDYFYDQTMHGVDWESMKEKYFPLVDRVTSREELSDVIAQMVAELSALHIFVRGGDLRAGDDSISTSFLGGRLEFDDAAGGIRIAHIYQGDPDEPERRSPLAAPEARLKVGDLITAINGQSVMETPHYGSLLRKQVGQQVLLHVTTQEGEKREVIVYPISSLAERDLRYHEWEYTRRARVDKESDNTIGYLHLRAMGGRNYTEWAKDYYPAFNRKGLIIDVRHNRGGNIDSWLLSRLLRKVWFYWNQHAGNAPSWNMQYAFRGHVVVLMNERTASDGEAFAEGIKRLDIGEVLGTRTWGGEIWLTSSNVLVDRGIATAAEFGVYGPDGDWLIEGHGVEPDQEVDNLPYETFKGRDRQLEAALEYLNKKIAEEPVEIPAVPPFPDKSFRNGPGSTGR